MQGALLTWLCFTNPVILPAFVWCGLGWGFWLPFAAHTAMPLTDRITVPLLPYNLAAWVESLIHYSVFSLHNSFYSSQALAVQIKLDRNCCPSFSTGKRTFSHELHAVPPGYLLIADPTLGVNLNYFLHIRTISWYPEHILALSEKGFPIL